MQQKERHHSPLPSARKIRRSCHHELYRAVKRMKLYLPEDLLAQGEKLYTDKVFANMLWIHDNGSNRKLLANWFDEAVSTELAQLWNVDRAKLSEAFRHTFGG